MIGLPFGTCNDAPRCTQEPTYTAQPVVLLCSTRSPLLLTLSWWKSSAIALDRVEKGTGEPTDPGQERRTLKKLKTSAVSTTD